MNQFKLIPLLIVLIGTISRLVPHVPNFAPITAIALFSGVYLPKKYAIILPLVSVLLSDLIIGFDTTTLIAVYASFILSGLIGLWIRSHKSPVNIFVGTVGASMLFFIITNLAVWLNPVSWYTKDLNGLIACYINAIPFFRNTLLGDLFYTGAFFGGYELVHNLAHKYLPQKLLKIYF
jgi:hypothetical protein